MSSTSSLSSTAPVSQSASPSAVAFAQDSPSVQESVQANIAKLGEIGQNITSSLDLETILTTVHNSVSELMETTIFGIAFYRVYEGMDSELEFLYYVENGKFEYMPSALMSEANSLAGWAVENRQPLLLRNTEQEFATYVPNTRAEERKTQSQMHFPLIAKNEPIGLITVQNAAPDFYTSIDADMLRTVASYTAVAIDNLNSYSRLAQAAAEMEVMNQSLVELNAQMKKINQDISTLSTMGQKITSTLDYETILTSVNQSVRELMDVDIFGIGVYREADSNDLSYILFDERGKESYHATLSYDDIDSIAIQSLHTRKEIILNNVAEEFSKHVVRLRPEESRSQSLVYFPLIIKNRAMGVLTVQSFQPNAYSTYQTDMLRTIATYTATAIDNIYAYSYLATSFAETENARTEIAQLNNNLIEVNNEKNEFLGIVAHDLKNPLSGIKMLSKVIFDQADSDAVNAEDIKDLANEILKSSARMFELITNLLDINAIERGGVRVNIEPFDLEGLAHAVTETYRARAEAKDIALHFESAPPVWYAVADQNATVQALDNIVSNAVKYSPHGKNVFVRLRTLESSRKIRVEVRDEGPGLSPEDKAKLFGKFARLTAQPTGGEHSTGLGLSIVKRMIEAMKGSVWCESELGHGAAFIIELPAIDDLDNFVV
jgi:signal transduction histidine kinase